MVHLGRQRAASRAPAKTPTRRVAQAAASSQPRKRPRRADPEERRGLEDVALFQPIGALMLRRLSTLRSIALTPAR